MEGFDRIPGLIKKHLQGTLTEDERIELDQWVKADEQNAQFFERVTSEPGLLAGLQGIHAINLEAGRERVLGLINNQGKVIKMGSRWKRYAAVAAIAIFLAGGAYLLKQNHKHAQEVARVPERKVQTDLKPGGNKAMLTLGNGEVIVLDSAGNGDLARQGNTKISKVGAGQLAYRPATGISPIFYNTVSTPRGGQYEISLPDGTRVWLNASSSLHFPTAFLGSTRKVELTGEAYFEVAKNPDMPFVVSLKNGEQVQVLGTHFDIMDYDDEPESKTSLLEGLVKVSNGKAVAMLHPGQQAKIAAGKAANQAIELVNDADLEQAVAWKNGFFAFRKTSLESVMRQISRWYDVDIEYKEPISKSFYGKVSRSSNVSAVFEMLEATGGVHFQLQGKKILVTR